MGFNGIYVLIRYNAVTMSTCQTEAKGSASTNNPYNILTHNFFSQFYLHTKKNPHQVPFCANFRDCISHIMRMVTFSNCRLLTVIVPL